MLPVARVAPRLFRTMINLSRCKFLLSCRVLSECGPPKLFVHQ